jgi:hypothetical protein
MRHTAILALSVLAVLVGPVWADWDETMPAKWVQRPNLEPGFLPFGGMDVKATAPKVLADDFECTSTGYITQVHIWGSWKGDYLPFGDFAGLDPLFGDPNAVDFRLSVHKDVPAGVDPAMPWSHPGELIWEGFYGPDQFVARPYAENLAEGWYDPNTNEYEPFGDTVCWQYNFDLNVAGLLPPYQTGTLDRPEVYWLDVSAAPRDDLAEFGWKTSMDHWNDDAVYSDIFPGLLYWEELRHPISDESLDLAFVIVPEPATLTLLLVGGMTTLVRRRSA